MLDIHCNYTQYKNSWLNGPETYLALYVMAHARYYLACQHHAGSSGQEAVKHLQAASSIPSVRNMFAYIRASP